MEYDTLDVHATVYGSEAELSALKMEVFIREDSHMFPSISQMRYEKNSVGKLFPEWDGRYRMTFACVNEPFDDVYPEAKAWAQLIKLAKERKLQTFWWIRQVR